MNQLQEAYLNGVVMAYKDCANHLREIAGGMPQEFGEMGYTLAQCLQNLATAMETKSENAIKEAERFNDILAGGNHDA